MPTKIEAFRSEDGSIHLTEGAALRQDVLTLLSNSIRADGSDPDRVKLVSEHGLTAIELCLPRLLPLLNRLSDPRNRAAAPSKPASDKAPMEPILGALHPGDPDLTFVDDEYPAIDPSELRLGQVVRVDYTGLSDDRLAIEGEIIHIDDDFNITITNKDQLPPDFIQPFDPSFVMAVLKQPEQTLGLVEAIEALSELPSEPDMTTPQGRLQHTRRILLMGRIEQLEKTDALD